MMKRAYATDMFRDGNGWNNSIGQTILAARNETPVITFWLVK
jgi:hypothetical protein